MTDLADRNTADIVALIEDEDLSLAKVAKQWNVAKTTLNDWINATADRSARVALARANAADACDRKAEQILLDLRADATPAQIARARELAAHYRWQAKIRNPATHGDKVQADLRVTVNPANVSDADLLAAAIKHGIVIEGMAELVSVDQPMLAAPPVEAEKPAE